MPLPEPTDDAIHRARHLLFGSGPSSPSVRPPRPPPSTASRAGSWRSTRATTTTPRPASTTQPRPPPTQPRPPTTTEPRPPTTTEARLPPTTQARSPTPMAPPPPPPTAPTAGAGTGAASPGGGAGSNNDTESDATPATPTGSTTSTNRKRGRKSTSLVWDDFDQLFKANARGEPVSDSEESEDGLGVQVAPCHLMEKRSLEKSILLELEREHHLKIQEEVRNKLAGLEICHQNEFQRTISAFARLQKYSESRKEIDRSLDVQFQRRIAEILDKHLSMIQRDHEQKSQIVERRIRDDAAFEEAKKKEQAIKEERLRQEKAKQEAEARQKEAAKAAAEARKIASEAAQKEAAEKEAAARSREREAVSLQSSQRSQDSVTGPTMVNRNEIRSELPGIKVFGDISAIEAESRRRALLVQVPGSINLGKEFSKYDRQIAKSISKLMPTIDSVRARASELTKALDGQDCPRPIACRIFANKIISIVKSRNTKDKTFGNLAFACGYLILLVTNQVPDAMDYILAEFHRVCIYTVPKHLHALNAQARNRDYYKLIGYQEENEQLESTESYLTYVVAYVKLYAALIQTEIKGVQHPHGLAEGWKWLAMFLNTLPATTATAYALHAFLKMAGFALHKKYGSQFMKILDVISRCFLPALREQGSKLQSEAVNNLQNYLNDKIYLEEPEGQYLAQQLLSQGLLA